MFNEIKFTEQQIKTIHKIISTRKPYGKYGFNKHNGIITLSWENDPKKWKYPAKDKLIFNFNSQQKGIVFVPDKRFPYYEYNGWLIEDFKELLVQLNQEPQTSLLFR
ncbi:hypothetical protein RyT2_30030 [Pseudolactococcus yaeyamensis]